METSDQLHGPVAVPPRETEADTHWVAPRSGLDALEIKKICNCRDSRPDTSVVRSVVQLRQRVRYPGNRKSDRLTLGSIH